MALTATQVQQFYIGYYGRPADPVGLTHWQTQTEAAALAGFATSAEFTNQFTGLSTSQQVTKVYGNLLGRTPDVAGLLYWAGEITAGRETIGSLVLSMIKNALGKDVTTIADRVTYSTAFTAALNTTEEVNAYAGAAATQAARDALLKVISTSVGDHAALNTELAKVDATIAAIVAGGGSTPGQTFTLTAGVDTIPGLIGTLGTTNNGGNDIIIAGEGAVGGTHNLGSSDVINGGTGTDQMNVKLNGQTVVPNMTSVEKVFVQALAGANGVNMVNATGTTEIRSDNSTANLAVTNLGAKATIGVTGGVITNNFTVQANAAAITGDLAISLNKAKVNDLIVNSTGVAGATGYASTTIDAVAGTTAAERNTVTTLDAGSALATVKVIGDGALTVTSNLAATVRTIDAAANKGGANLSITNNTGNVTYTGGEGADRINFGGTLNISDKVDGGALRDTLGVTNETLVVTGLQVSNVEILELAALGGALDASLIAGVDEVQVAVAGGLSAVANTAVVNKLGANSTFVTASSGEVTLNITNAQVAGTLDTLNLKTNIAGGAGNVLVKAPGVETIAYTQSNIAGAAPGAAVTTVNFADNDGVIDVTTLTIASNDNNTAIFNGLVNTIKTVNASAAAGDVTVSVLAGNPTNGIAITGGSGDDRLTGGDGKDAIIGNAGDDVLQGDAAVGIAQITQLTTFGTVNIGDVYSFTVNGQSVSFTATAATEANVIAGLAAAVNGNAIIAAAGITAAFNATILQINGNVSGASFTVANVASTNGVATAEVDKLAIVGTADNGDTFRVTLSDGDAGTALAWEKNYDTAFLATATTAQVRTALINTLNGDAAFVAGGLSSTLGVDGLISITGPAAGTNVQVAAVEQAAGLAQKQIFTLAGLVDTEVAIGDVFRLTINGVTKEYASPDGNAASAIAGLVNLVNSDPAINGAVVAASPGAGSLTITAATAGVPFTTAITQNAGALSTATDATTYAQTTANITVSTPTFTVTDDVVVGSPVGANPQTLPTQTLVVTGVLGGTANTDTLTGGDGKDSFVVLSSGLTTMDSITDMNFGGAAVATRVDTIDLTFAVGSLVNAGVAVAMTTAPTLTAAVDVLFAAGGVLNAQANKAGLFTYGGDSYVVVANGAGAVFGADDVIIKVTGVTGTLDLTDLI